MSGPWRPATVLLASLGLLASCGKDELRLASDVVSLRVEPAQVDLVVSPGDPQEVDFTAWATFKDGDEEELDLVSWSSSNLSAGLMDSSGLFTTFDTNGGVTEVVATHLELTASAAVRVVYEDHLFEEGADEALQDAFAAASPAETSDLRMQYPPSGAAVPRNLEGLGFQWPALSGHDVARVRLQTEITDISVYVTGNRWVSSSEVFALVTASNRGGSVDVTVESGSWDGSTLSDVKQSPINSLTVNRFDARGSVIYWESSDEAIMRIPFGSLESTEFWTSEDSDGQCTGCHVASNETDLMVVSHGGIDGRFSIIDIADPEALEVVVGQRDDARTTFKTLSPNGRFMVGSNKKQLTIFDAATGGVVEVYEHPQPLTQPDFSPDGDSLVAVRVTGQWNSDFDFLGGELVRIPWDGEHLGEPELLLAADPDWNFYYPAYAPDGEWIAFNRTVGFGYASNHAQLMVIHEDGGAPILLDRANGVGELRNSYPRWGPLPDDDVLWLAYSSLRSYPLELTDLPQIWVTSVDVTAAAAGEDPSTAPFWLPGQDPRSDNHLPFWWNK